MNLKAKIAMGMVSATLGATAIMGGTFAYFSSSTEATSHFHTGTIVVAPNSTYLEHFNLVNFKPGDLLDASVPNQEPAMTLNNQGTLPFHVIMKVTDTTTKNLDQNLVIRSMNFGSTNVLDLVNAALGRSAGTKVTLKDLADATASAKATTTVNASAPGGDTASTWQGLNIGDLFPAGSNANPGDANQSIKSLTYKIALPDNGQDQNALQDADASFLVHFDAIQFDGKTYSNQPTSPTNIQIGNGSNGSTTPSGGGDFTASQKY